MNSSSTNSGDTHIDVNFSGRRVSFAASDDVQEPLNHDITATATTTIPLLLQPLYARSKSFLSDELRHLRTSLKWSALDHSTCTGKFISYLAFLLLAVVVPAVSSVVVRVPSDDPLSINKLVQLPTSGLAAIAFFSLSRFFSRYGLRQLLFLDGLRDDSLYVRRRYTGELDRAFRYLAFILLPSFFVELAHKIMFFSVVKIKIPLVVSPGVPANSVIFVLVLASWVYRTGVFLLVCVLFRLTCELQILRFEGLHKLFEEGCESEASVIFEEHTRIKKQLSVTSHRYRFFIIASLVVITVSQLGALLLVLAPKSQKNFFNSGDLVVCSAVQLSGFFLGLLGAARITHRAQGIVSIATRWHMLVTSASSSGGGSDKRKGTVVCDVGKDEYDGSDSGSDIFVTDPLQDPPSNFHSRQALVTYLQHNNGGITLFGFALDRGLLHTIFAFEFSLVLWILSKVVVLST